MGGFFGGAPEVPAPAPLPPVTDPEAEARAQRLETMSRNRRGRQGMIATSDRGVLAPAGGDGKRLLGE
jgi:hypothetical protein